MDRQGAINTAKAQGYSVHRIANPKSFEIVYTTASGNETREWIGRTHEEALDEMEAIGNRLAADWMNF